MPTATRVSLTAVLCLGCLVAALALREKNLAEGAWWLPSCTLNDLTGLYCPSCGNTRATQALLRGDLALAWRQNPAFLIALPFLCWGAIHLWVGWMFPGRKRPLPFRWRHSYSLALIVLVVAFGVLRNLPGELFRFLAPEPIIQSPEEEPALRDPGNSRPAPQ